MDLPATVRPFGLRDKIGYAFGDFGNDFTFILSSSFMMLFYTNVMGISSTAVGVLMMASRFLDAFTDVTMGRLIDRAKPTTEGRFRPLIKRMCGPVAVASFLIYQSGLAGMPYWFKVVWMTVTYILWGSIFYTAVNIPYGSMASAISGNPRHRAELSVWRTVGATLAGLAIGFGTPLFAYIAAENGAQILSGPRMTLIAGLFSIAAVVCYLLCFHLTRERVELPPGQGEQAAFSDMLKSVSSDRALLGIILAAILLLLAMLGMGGMAGYMFPIYYQMPAGQSMATLLGSVVVLAVCVPFAVPLAERFGKKEVSIGACLFGAVCYGVCWWVRPQSVWAYVGFYTAAYMGLGFFNTLVWAMITDVIDNAQVRERVRRDGTIYAVYSFARKVGQALSSGMVGWLLGVIGYTQTVQYDPWAYPQVMDGMFTLSCLIPVLGLTAVALVLWLVYPLSKAKVRANAEELARRQQSQETDNLFLGR